MTRRSPSECFCSIATRLRTRARVLAHGLKALEEPVFGPWSRIPCTGRHQRMRVRLSLRKSGCTLGRTWGTRPEPTTVVVSQNPARSCRPNLDRFGLYRLCVAEPATPSIKRKRPRSGKSRQGLREYGSGSEGDAARDLQKPGIVILRGDLAFRGIAYHGVGRSKLHAVEEVESFHPEIKRSSLQGDLFEH